jgi:hypothetical protein
MAADIYCIDASSLIDLKHFYRREVFSALWEKVEELVSAGRLTAPDEVFQEIKDDDILGPWAKTHKKMFRKLDQEQMDAAKEVASRFPRLAKPGRFGPAADPFVVALAQLENRRLSGSLLAFGSICVVVTNERRDPGKIPAACAHYKLTCMALVDLFQREGWKF